MLADDRQPQLSISAANSPAQRRLPTWQEALSLSSWLLEGGARQADFLLARQEFCRKPNPLDKRAGEDQPRSAAIPAYRGGSTTSFARRCWNAGGNFLTGTTVRLAP